MRDFTPFSDSPISSEGTTKIRGSRGSGSRAYGIQRNEQQDNSVKPHLELRINEKILFEARVARVVTQNLKLSESYVAVAICGLSLLKLNWF